MQRLQPAGDWFSDDGADCVRRVFSGDHEQRKNQMIQERELDDLKHDAEAASEIGETMVVRVNCVTMLEILEELEQLRVHTRDIGGELERYRLQAFRRVIMSEPERD